ncbi:MAG TPA: cellulase N-terminal Ig-like domain-containing protein, partial [Prolixibacteraceae bacterium]|nr:cellulase N-terminal Ig-like domain-containing protein [Prolixibacteraceae bacterium]
MKFITFLSFLINITHAQTHHSFIVVDQFGYLPDANKIAVIKNPQVGLDSDEEYIPGKQFALVDAQTHKQVLTGTAKAWKNGKTDTSSGNKVWHFDFSEHTKTGSYYVLDIDNNYLSYAFQISPSVYNEVLKHAMRTFFYQRAGFAKKAQYAREEWADGASHTGDLQEIDDYGRLTKKRRAAVYLFEVTGNTEFQTFFDNNYTDVNLFEWNFAFTFQTANQEMVL